jgi:hypothetical protein
MNKIKLMVGFVSLFLLLFLPSFDDSKSALPKKGEINPSLSSDFKIAPDTPLHEGSEFHDVGIASDSTNGYLVVWKNECVIKSESWVTWDNYACRISKTGEMLDTTAIYLNESPWPYYCSSAVFLGGNWIISTNQASYSGLHEWVGVTRLSPSGVILDNPPVNICDSVGEATLLWPTIATNGQVILCVAAIAGKGLYGSICDSVLNILVGRFLILPDADADTPYKIAANGENFFLTFLNWPDRNMKLTVVNPKGEILSVQNVNDQELQHTAGGPSITTLNSITYVSFFDTENFPRNLKPALFVRRYSSDGSPIDSKPIKIVESPDFPLFLDDLEYGMFIHAYTDLVWANKCFLFFWPRMSDPGISLMSFSPELSTTMSVPRLVNDQCQYKSRFEDPFYRTSWSLIRAASNGNKVLTAWIDGREGRWRVYGELFEDLCPGSYSLVLSATSGGTTDPVPGTYTRDAGSQVTIKANPNTSYEFSGWSGDASGTENPLTVKFDSDKSITANFRLPSTGGGDKDEEKSKSKCFIATLCFGTSLAEEVRILCDFRDKFLLTNPLGRMFVSLYYQYAPKMADFIREKEGLKKLGRACLRPIVWIASQLI